MIKRYTTICQVSPYCDQEFSFYRSNIRIDTPTYTHRDKSDRYILTAVLVVGVDNNHMGIGG